MSENKNLIFFFSSSLQTETDYRADCKHGDVFFSGHAEAAGEPCVLLFKAQSLILKQHVAF